MLKNQAVTYLNEKMMKTVTASQQPVFASIKENLECIMDVLETHKTSDWILTPEGSLSGYCANVCHEGLSISMAYWHFYIAIVLSKNDTFAS